MLGIIGLLLAITVLILGAYKSLEAIPLTLLSAFVVIITNGLPIWTPMPAYTPRVSAAPSKAIFSFSSHPRFMP